VLWHYQILTEASYNLLAILAGLNHQYFTTFQFKRMQHFTAQLSIAPFDFAARLDRLFTAEFPAAALELEALVGETIELVAQHMPQIEVSGVRQKIGQRKPAWKFVE